MTSVLDASALLAYLHDEPGADPVGDAIVDGAHISAANFAEVLSKLADTGRRPAEVVLTIRGSGFPDSLLMVEPLTEEDAITMAEIREKTGRRNISLGDRACLALGIRLGLPILTGDRVWSELGLGVEIRPIR